MKNTIIDKIRDQLLDIVKSDGLIETGVAGMKISRREKENVIINCIYEPLIILIIQGSKNAVYGTQGLTYKEGDIVITGINMPAKSYVTSGTPKAPFLAISMPIDNDVVSSLITALPNETYSYNNIGSVAIDRADDIILDAFSRLIDTLSSKNNKNILAPMIIREIHYLILTSKIGALLRMINTYGSVSSKISKTINYLRENFNKPISINELADIANMASSTFRRHFTNITSLSPIQYQKKLRLHEAQRLLVISDDNNATSVAYTVGYESITQFNREYKRLFGETPKRNVKNILQLH